MKRNLYLSLLPLSFLVVLSSCAYNRNYAETKTVVQGTNGVVTTIYQKARSTTYASGDAKSSIGKERASAGKTASVGASDVNAESSTTNFASNIDSLGRLLEKLPK